MNRLMTADSYDNSELSLSAYGDFGSFVDIASAPITYHSGLPLFWQEGKPASGRNVSTDFDLVLKRAFDIASSAMALFFLAPLLLAVALIIKTTSKGPVFFRQDREGIDGSVFNVLKFRSMRTDECDYTGVNQTIVGDPRITPIGRFIRRTSIDELPQLINVLRGDMSLVGPRPHVAGMIAGGTLYKTLVPYYDLRLQMRPGLTGWAQANGFRGPTTDVASAVGRVDHDVAYIQNFSFLLDVKIVLLTVVREFFTGSGH